jgi:hypothetical protein
MRDDRLILAKLILGLRRHATVISKVLPMTVNHPMICTDVRLFVRRLDDSNPQSAYCPHLVGRFITEGRYSGDRNRFPVPARCLFSAHGHIRRRLLDLY